MDAQTTYETGRTFHDREWHALDMRLRALGAVLLASFLLLAISLVLALGGWRAGWWVTGGLAAIFLAAALPHARASKRQDRAAASRRFHEIGLSRLDGSWRRSVDGGERFRSPAHPYSDDLDVFGRASLFAHIDVTRTRWGEERLAALLGGEGIGRFPDDVQARADAVRELASRVAFREALYRAGDVAARDQGSRVEASSFLKWAEASPALHAARAATTLAQIAGGLLSALALGLIAAYFVGRVPIAYPCAVVALEVALARVWRDETRRALDGIGALHVAAGRYEELVALIEAEAWSAPLLRELQGRLAAAADRASAKGELGRLARIVSFVNARENDGFRLGLSRILLWDPQWSVPLDRWRARAGGHARVWFEAVAEVEALASLAGFAFDRPDHAFAELVTAPTFDARALAHPLIARDARVGNDVRISVDAPALLLTGSNMSGKSTLLRSMGTNTVLALAGAPVCASRLTLGPLRVVTSMRVRDSLDQNVSTFYAELLRLKSVIDLAFTPSDRAVLFLLDEILHGTNSRERILGGRSLVRRLLRSPALGVVSTHDLGLGGLEEELGGRVRNAHFEEQITNGKMTFDYKLREGTVQSSNALRLMLEVGIDVSDVLEEVAHA